VSRFPGDRSPPFFPRRGPFFDQPWNGPVRFKGTNHRNAEFHGFPNHAFHRLLLQNSLEERDRQWIRWPLPRPKQSNPTVFHAVDESLGLMACAIKKDHPIARFHPPNVD